MQELNRESEKNCRVAKWYTDQDSCQAQDYERCATCGTSEGNGCRLSEAVIANLLQREESEKKSIEERIANAKRLAREIVRVERVEQGLPVPVYDKPKTAWNGITYVAAALVIISYAPDAYKVIFNLLFK